MSDITKETQWLVQLSESIRQSFTGDENDFKLVLAVLHWCSKEPVYVGYTNDRFETIYTYKFQTVAEQFAEYKKHWATSEPQSITDLIYKRVDTDV